MMNNNNDNKDIKFTGDPVAFDGVEGKRDPKSGKGRFDLIPTEVYHPLFKKAESNWFVDCHPAAIMQNIADEKFIDAIIQMTIYAYCDHIENNAIQSSAFWPCVWPMLQDLAIHFQKGAEHYGERNCQNGIPLWSFKDSAMRHAAQVFEGKEDEPHKISVIWNLWMAQWTVIQERRKVVDAISGPAMTLYEMNKDWCNPPTNKEQTPREKAEEKLGPYTVKALKTRTPEEIEAAKSAASTPELKTMKVQAALKEVREEGYVVMKPTWAMDTDELIKCISELLTKKRQALKTSMHTYPTWSPEYDVFCKEQKRLKRIINAIYTTSDDAETKTDNAKDNLEEMRSFIETLKKFAEEHEFPIMTAIQHFYTREEVEAIKKETAEKAIEAFLKDKGNIERAICEFGSVNIIDKLEEIPLDKQRVFDKQFVDLMETSEGKERAMAWYSPIYLFNELIERVEEKQGQHDYHDFVPLLLQLNSTYAEFLDNNKTEE